MNDRIQELAEQAAEYCKTQPREMAGTMWEEKLAELIVKECIANVKDWEKDSRNHISYMLERHFGVE